jgi:hypothetical protein
MAKENLLRYGGAVTVLLCALGLTGALANAQTPMIEIVAEYAEMSDAVTITDDMGEYGADQAWTYVLLEPLEFYYEDTYLGTLETLDAFYDPDPEVNLNFSVQAGGTNTTFHIASSLLTFDTITSPEGQANAAFTLTDFDADDASLTGIGDTGGGYLAQYNGWAGHPAGPMGTTFAEGIYSMSAGFLETVTQDFEYPASGWEPIAESVDSASSLVSFELSANDLASGTSHFEIIPEPGTLGLLMLAGMFLLRRRS